MARPSRGSDDHLKINGGPASGWRCKNGVPSIFHFVNSLEVNSTEKYCHRGFFLRTTEFCPQT